jgi:hypothetical protein
VIAPTYGLEYRSQHFRHGCVGSKFLKPVLLPVRNEGGGKEKEKKRRVGSVHVGKTKDGRQIKINSSVIYPYNEHIFIDPFVCQVTKCS